MCGCFLGRRGCTVSLLMLQQKEQLSDLSGECFEGGFPPLQQQQQVHSVSVNNNENSSGEEGNHGDHKWCFAQDPRLSEETKAVAQRLGMNKIQLWYITGLQMSFFICVWQL